MAIPSLRPAAFVFCALSFSVSAQTVLLENIELVDVKNLTVKSAQTLVIDGDKIKAVYATGSKKTPANSTVLNMEGLYVLPGLIDAHVHHATEPEGGDNAAATQKRLSALLRGA